MNSVEQPLITMNALLHKVPVSRPTIYRLMQKGDFPKPVEIGRSRFWIEQEVEDWKRGKILARDA